MRLQFAALAALCLPAVAVAQDTAATLREWNVPWAGTRPRDPYLGPDGRIWFVGQTGDYVAVLNPGNGEFKRYELAPGTGPHNLIVDKAGMIWYAGNRAAHIGRLDPKDGSITRYPMPDAAARDPHTLIFDKRGDIWFTVQGGNFIGKLTVATGAVRLVPVPTPRARPYGIGFTPDGHVWVVLFGTNKLAHVDPATFTLTEHTLPRAETRPRRIAFTSDGAVWYGDYAAGMLGRFDPATGKVEEFPLPGGAGARPYAMAADDKDRVWVVETGAQPNRFVGFDAKARRFLAGTDVPSGGGTLRHMVFDPAQHVIWFGADANTVGRAQLPGQGAAVP